MKTNADRVGNRTPSETSINYGIPAANSSGKLSSGWGGAASSLATLDSSALVPLAQIPSTLTGKDADTVDTFHASQTVGQANKILVTGTDGTMPIQPVWNFTVTGSAITSKASSDEVTLDGNAHGGYEFEFIIINSNAGTARYRLYYNNDTTNANYNFHALYSTAANALGTYGNDALFESSGVGTGGLIVFRGSITITPTGAVMTQSINHVHGVTNMDVYIHKKIATVANLTRIDIVSSVANGIGISSRFRLWRKI